MIYLYNILYFILFSFFSLNLYGLDTDKLLINGNEYIDEEVIISIIKDISSSDLDHIDQIIKRLYASGSFQNVSVVTENSNLVINLKEQPKINKIEFVGNKRFKESEIYSLFDNNFSFKYFNDNEIQKFIKELKKLYQSYGYNQIDINYDTIAVDSSDNDFVDVRLKFTEGKISKISKVFFIGNDTFDKKTLLDKIISKPRNTIIFFTSRNYKSFEAKNDIIRLIRFYNENGFRNVNIDLKTEFNETNNKFNLYFYIVEGQRFKFNEIKLNYESISLSTNQITSSNTLLAEYSNELFFKESYYNPKHLDKFKNNLSDYLFSEGLSFFDVRILEKVEDYNVNIIFNIVSNKPKYVKRINIYGNTRTLDKVIRREIAFAEGDAINDFLIHKSSRNLSSLDIFKSINIDEKIIDDENVDINVEIEEKPTGDFNIGVSIGSLEGATFLTGLKEKNIGGLGRNVEIAVNTSSNNTTYRLNILEPYIFNRDLSLIYGIDYTEKDYSSSASYNLDSFISSIGVKYDLTDDLSHNIMLKYQLKDYEITNSSLVSSNIASAEGANAEFNLNNLLVYNKLNSFIRPTDGSYMSFSNIFSPITNSDNGYIKNLITYKKYNYFNKNIFSIQTKLGNILSLQDTEILTDDKFSLGGRWLRGFDSYGAGPRNSASSYTGGNNLFVTKLDYKRSIFDKTDNPIDFNLFTDFGTTFGNKNDPTYNDESMRASYGLGFNFYSPIGPIGFSWAFPLVDESYDIKRMFLFSVGNLN